MFNQLKYNIMTIKPFEEIRSEVVTSLLTVLAKHYGQDLDIMQGMELAGILAYKMDTQVRKFIKEADEYEKNSIAARTKVLK
jgi:UDP-N-acetylmuramate-alanine ligase